MAKANILIVEDEALIAKDIKETLEALGYNVLATVDNGKDAINLAKESKPDLILMDIVIKGPLDGIQTTEKIHSELDIPVIYLTAYADESKLQRAKITEPFGYIIKPFEEKALHSAIEMALYRHKSEKEKQALKEQVIKLTRKIPLTDNEKFVFYGVIHYPLFNDIELARILKIKRSTVTAIRNKLSKEGYFCTYRIPNLSAIGCELLTVMYGKLNKLNSKKTEVLKEISSVPEQVYLTTTNNELMGICISKNFSDCKMHIDSATALLNRGGIAENLCIAYFPLQKYNYENFFNYGRYVKKRLEIELSDRLEKLSKPKQRKLTQNEKRILYALVKYPSFTDSEIASATKIPRPSISQTRRRLIKEGLLYTINMPYLVKLRSELIILNHVSFDAGISAEQAKLIEDFFNKFSSSIFLISGNIELCTINLYDDYSEYEHEKTEQAKFFHENRLDSKASNIFTIPDIEIMSLNFAPLVKKVLDIKVNF